MGSYELGDPATTGGFGVPGPSSAERWRSVGLDRLTTRVLSLDVSASGLVVVSRLAAAQASVYADVTQRWSWVDGELRLEVAVEPSDGWTVTWPRVGVHLVLPAGYEEASWFGAGPGENYADSRVAARVGRFSACLLYTSRCV